MKGILDRGFANQRSINSNSNCNDGKTRMNNGNGENDRDGKQFETGVPKTKHTDFNNIVVLSITRILISTATLTMTTTIIATSSLHTQHQQAWAPTADVPA